MVSRMLEQNVLESDEVLKLAISGGEYAPGLVRFMEAQGVELAKVQLDEQQARAAVRTGTRQVIVLVPKNYPDLFLGAAPAPVLLIADSSDSQNRKNADRARRILGAYGSSIAQLRLQVRGVNPLLATPVAINEVDVATPSGRAVVVLGFMTYFILFAVVDGRPVSGHRLHRR